MVLRQSYSGFFCLCACTQTPEGLFCQGAGLSPSLATVARFAGVFYQRGTAGAWEGRLVGFNRAPGLPDFEDVFVLERGLGMPMSYTGVSQSGGANAFVWRGVMSGLACATMTKVARMALCAWK